MHLKLTLLFIWGCCSFSSVKAQSYKDACGHELILRADSTFIFSWNYDLMHRWSTGNWKQHSDTLWLSSSPVWDTVIHGSTQSLHLSNDKLAQTWTDSLYQQFLNKSSSAFQDTAIVPAFLLVHTKQHCIYYDKHPRHSKFIRYFRKRNCYHFKQELF